MSILNVDNYNKKLNIEDKNKFLKSYVRVINDYLKHIIDRVYGDYNNDYYVFIITRGLNTLKHIFMNLTTYTKNIDMVVYHSDKSTLYYVEFIEQIGNDNNSYLKLNSKDAALFIYKKTLFDINNEYRKKFTLVDSEKKLLSMFEYTIQIINIFLSYVLNCYMDGVTDIERRTDKFKKNIQTKLDKDFKHILKILNICVYDVNDVDNIIKTLKLFLHFIDLLLTKNLKDVKFFLICELFVKTMTKYNITNDIINKKMLNNDFAHKLENPYTFKDWMFDF